MPGPRDPRDPGRGGNPGQPGALADPFPRDLARYLAAATGRTAGTKATIGIGHTRWATHGEPNEVNAHPHTDTEGRIAVVHNGIIENAEQLRDALTAKGVKLASDTDTEALAHMIAAEVSPGTSLEDAVRRTLRHVA